MDLSKILLYHAVITFAAGIALIIDPGFIPSTIHVSMSADQYIICYFLGAAELAISFLSFAGRKITDIKSLKLIASTMIVFHLLTALCESYAVYNGTDKMVLVNVIIRIIVSLVFYYYGYIKLQVNSVKS